MAHVHSGSCDLADPGGPHFKFDPNGGDMPPNEVHLHFTSDGSGNGGATADLARPLPEGQTLTIVVHASGPTGVTPKVACAALR